jgi:hypothetical protein
LDLFDRFDLDNDLTKNFNDLINDRFDRFDRFDLLDLFLENAEAQQFIVWRPIIGG